MMDSTKELRWVTPAEIDTNRNMQCRVRLRCGREMKAIWTENDCGARYWICEDNKARGLYDIAECLVEYSLPFPKVPGGELTDAELLADCDSHLFEVG